MEAEHTDGEIEEGMRDSGDVVAATAKREPSYQVFGTQREDEAQSTGISDPGTYGTVRCEQLHGNENGKFAMSPPRMFFLQNVVCVPTVQCILSFRSGNKNLSSDIYRIYINIFMHYPPAI